MYGIILISQNTTQLFAFSCGCLSGDNTTISYVALYLVQQSLVPWALFHEP